MPRTLDGQITMEKTPSYFITREAPSRVFSMSRSTKLIVVVRDPVTRAVSDYTQTLTKNPGLPSFQNLVFKNSTTGLIDTSWSAVRIGIYSKHLENWLRYFPLAQLLFVSGEKLVTDPAGEMTKGRPHPHIPPEVLHRLRNFYRPFNMKFYQMTGQDFGWE
ncbi:hypothetical protein PO909_015717 [Leuciscus waleckii]